MPEFYVLLVVAMALTGSLLAVTFLGRPDRAGAYVMWWVILLAAVATLVISLWGIDRYSGYTHLDPEKCAQMVYIERNWTCVTWNEVA